MIGALSQQHALIQFNDIDYCSSATSPNWHWLFDVGQLDVDEIKTPSCPLAERALSKSLLATNDKERRR